MTNLTKQKLGDFAKVKGGKRLPNGFLVQNDKTEHPYIRVTDMKFSGLDTSDIKYVPDEAYGKISRYTISSNDVYISNAGTVGFTGKIPEYLSGANLTENSAKITELNKSLINQDYLIYFLRSHEGQFQIKSRVGGSSQPKLALNKIETIEVPKLSVSQQAQIATVLLNYDDLIENDGKRIKILEDMAQRLYTEWFVNFKFPGHEKVKIVDSPLGKMPDGWEVKKIEDVCSKITDGSHWSPKTVDAGYPMASVKDMNNWGFDIEPCRKISEADYAKLVKNDCKPKIDDVLIAKDGSYLKHVFIVNKEIDLVILSSIAILRPNDKLLPELLRLYLLEPNIKSRMTSYVSGAALPRIILDSFRKFPIIVPLLSVQQQFNNIISSTIKLRNSLLDTNNRSVRIRDLLIPQLVTGKREIC